MNNTVLFLFTELSGYVLACFNYASENGFNVHVVNYPVNKDAPFELEKSEKETSVNTKLKKVELVQ